VPKVSVYLNIFRLLTVNRCMASRKELDTEALYRHRVHTETLVQAGVFSLVQLWDEYGIVGQLVVSVSNYVHIDH
jgi:hypothetical protein